MPPAARITTDVFLEPLLPAHAERMFEGLRDPAAYAFLPDDPPGDVESLRARYARQSAGQSRDGRERWFNWIIRRDGDEDPLGYTQATLVDGSALIAYHVFPSCWRQGVATKAVRATLDLVFRMPEVRCARALVDTRNIASIRLLERLGFLAVRHLENADFFRGAPSSEWEFELPAAPGSRPSSMPYASLPYGSSRTLTTADIPAIFDLYRRCSDYFLLQDGEPPSRSDAETLFTDVPPGRSADDQWIVGSWRQSTLCLLAAIMMDYPGAGDRYLGFLLLDPSLRRNGVGRQTYLALERRCQECGARRMLVAVLEGNGPALRFWRSLGFGQLRITGPTRYKDKEHVVIELAKLLPEIPAGVT